MMRNNLTYFAVLVAVLVSGVSSAKSILISIAGTSLLEVVSETGSGTSGTVASATFG